MKRLIFSIFLLSIIGCSPRLMPREVIVSYFDYSKHAEKGFFISPDPYVGDFTPCGEIVITVKPGNIRDNSRKLYDPGTQTYVMSDQVTRERIDPDELVQIAVDKALELGANGLVNFKCLIVNSSYYNSGLKQVITTLSHYEVRGYAIKRAL